MSELFPTELRGLGIGAWYNLTVAVFGGTAPLVIQWLGDTGHSSWFFWYVSVGAAVAFVATLDPAGDQGVGAQVSRAADLLPSSSASTRSVPDEARLARSRVPSPRASGLAGFAWSDFEDGREQFVARSGGEPPLTFTAIRHGARETVGLECRPVRSGGRRGPDGRARHQRHEVRRRRAGRGRRRARRRRSRLPRRAGGADPRARRRAATGASGPGAMPGPRRAGLVVAEPTANRLVPAHKGVRTMRLTAHRQGRTRLRSQLGDNAAVRWPGPPSPCTDFDGWPPGRLGGVTANIGVLHGGSAAQRRTRQGGDVAGPSAPCPTAPAPPCAKACGAW